MTSESAASSFASWFNVAGLSSLSPPLPPAAAAVAAGRTSMLSVDRCTRVMSTERPTGGDGSHGGADQLMVGLTRRPSVLYTDDQRDLISSTLRPTAVEAAAVSSNYSYSYTKPQTHLFALFICISISCPAFL